MIGDPTLADAILDRLVHNAHRIQLKGESLRKPRLNMLIASERLLRTEVGRELAEIRGKLAELVEKRVAAEDQLKH